MMNWLTCISLLALTAGGSPDVPESVTQSARRIPLVAETDVLVVGGTLGAVAAAVEASRAGADVWLIAPRTYLGDDLCGTLRLWRGSRGSAAGELSDFLFGDRPTATPLEVKKRLEAALLEADVRFLFGSFPTDVLCDDRGSPAAVIIANRAGRQAIGCRAIIDASDTAAVARMAGAEFATAADSQAVAYRTVLGGEASGTLPARSVPAGVAYQQRRPEYYEYRLELDFGDGGFPAEAEAEQQARDRTYRQGQLRAAERLLVVRPRHIAGRVSESSPSAADRDLAPFQPRRLDRLYVLSGAADVPRDQVLQLLQPDCLERLGRRIGRAAADAVRAGGELSPPAGGGEAGGSAAGLESSGAGGSLPGEVTDVAEAAEAAEAAETVDVREVLQGLRPTDRGERSVAIGACEVPVWADVDVLVVGGGTSGACAAIGAARRGARVLVIEYQEGLGGVGTVGLIGRPYHGRNAGFTREVPFPDQEHNVEHKMEWFRRQIREAGGQIWLGAIGCGAVVQGDRVCGAVVATTFGRGAVRASVVIDATGSADIAVAAGAAWRYGGDGRDIALQGTGLPLRPLGATYVNTDYLLVDEADALDTWRALVGVRLTGDTGAYDVGSFIQNRERRRVVGDHTLTYLDQIAGRTYPDSIVLSGSDYDSHGYPSDIYFALIPHTEKTLKANHPAPGGTCYTPYRCLLPAGLEGLLVTGLGISMDRDASAMVRMQKDMHNQGYAAGVAAAMAVDGECPPRQIPVRRLQEHLVQIGNLPPTVLTDRDSFPLPDAEVRQAVAAVGDDSLPRESVCRALAVVLSHREQAAAMLKSAFTAAEGAARLEYAKLLGVLADREVVPELIAALEQVTEWDAKIFQGNMAEYAHLPTPIDALILALGFTGDPRALPPILAKLETLDADVTLSHHRAVALALEEIADPAAAEPLARLLKKPGMRGHAMLELEPLYDRLRDRRRREGPLREIVLARALYRCGDHDGLAHEILSQYERDLRGLFARHARAVLESP